MYTVGKLGKEFGLSRTTLLYYDEIDLLVPSERSASNPKLVKVLEARLDNLNKEIKELRIQQNVIISILKNRKLLKKTRYMDRKSWTELLKIAGLDERARHKWHLEFEKMSPEAHRDFLEQLGFSDIEIKNIKKWLFEHDEK